MTVQDRSRGPLAGLRVVDLSPDRVGAAVSQTLADFGADVLWVEPPGGARLRGRPEFPFLARGKRSVVADLTTVAGVAQVRELAASADVLVETFRPGVAERLGLGHEALAADNPGLVHTSITGFGRQGPWAALKGYEGVVAAVSGLFDGFRGIHTGAHPPFVAVPWCTFSASHSALQGTLAALLERERSGRGQWVETNLLQSLGVHEGGGSSWYRYLVAERWPDAVVRIGAVTDGVPASPFVFRLLVAQTKDGRWLQFAQNRPRLFEAFLRALGLDWMLTDPKWAGIPALADPALRLDLWTRLLAAVRERTLAEWEAVFAADHDVYAELFRSGPEVLGHPQLAHDGSVVELVDPERGPVRQPGPLCRLSATPAAPPRPAPLLGDAGDTGWTPAGPRRSAEASPTRPALEGVTVLELAIQYAAPYAATLLADLGARVIKVEPLTGDPIRAQAPQFPEVGGAKPMQGKDSIAVDLGTAEGRAIVHRLAEHADVVIEGFRAGAAERLGIDAVTLRGINPDLVYVSAHGYGVDGPCADRPAFAPTFGAACGIAAAQLGGLGPEDASIGSAGVAEHSDVLRAASAATWASADGIAALGAASSALLGLLARARGAGGQHVLASMLQSAVHAMAEHVVAAPGSAPPQTPGPDFRGPSALYHVYDAADGWVFLAAPQATEWPALARALAPHADLPGDPRFAGEADRAANDAALTDALAEVFRSRGKDDWQRVLTAADVACVAVSTGDPEALLMSEEYGRAGGYITDVSHPVFDVHPRLAPIVRFSRSTVEPKGAELCGNATDRVLTEIGYDPEHVADLRARSVVG